MRRALPVGCRLGCCRDRLVLPGTQRTRHALNEVQSRLREPTARQQGLDDLPDAGPPKSELGVRPQPGVPVGPLALRSPEPSDAKKRIGALKQAADRTRVFSPWRVIAPAVVRQRQ
jgi:hypothetical protein